MALYLNLIGAAMIVLALIHAIFPKYFEWKKDLASLTLINHEMMKIHTFFIALVLLLMGMLCVTCAVELTNTPLGRRVSLGIGIFWGARFFVQLFGYSAELWRGKRFETVVHILFLITWSYFTTVFLWVALGNNG